MTVTDAPFFDTLRVRRERVADGIGFRLRRAMPDSIFAICGMATIGISLDETTTRQDVQAILESFAGGATLRVNVDQIADGGGGISGESCADQRISDASGFQSVSQRNGNAAVYFPADEPGFVAGAVDDSAGVLHDEAERDERNDAGDLAGVCADASVCAGGSGAGICGDAWKLEAWLAKITGFSAVSLQPNAGSQGEYAGLLVIRAYHEHRGRGRAEGLSDSGCRRMAPIPPARWRRGCRWCRWRAMRRGISISPI